MKRLVGLTSVSVLLAFICGWWPTGLLGILLIVGVLKRSELMRKALVVCTSAGVLVGAILTIAVIKLMASASSLMHGDLAVLYLCGMLVVTVLSGYAVWVLTRPDVKKWMSEASRETDTPRGF